MKNIDEFNELKDKTVAFESIEKIRHYAETQMEVLRLFEELDDEQKFKVIQIPYFRDLGQWTNCEAILGIKNEKYLLKLLSNPEFNLTEIIGKFSIGKVLEQLSEETKVALIANQNEAIAEKYQIDIETLNNIIDRYEIGIFDLERLMRKMSIDNIDKALFSESTKYKSLPSLFLSRINNDEYKMECINKGKISKGEMSTILSSLTDGYKIDFFLSGEYKKYDLNRWEILSCLGKMSIESLIDFTNNNQKFMGENEITVYDILRSSLFGDDQLKYVYHIDEFMIDENEKKKIYAGLDNSAKDKVDRSKIDAKYYEYLDLRVSNDAYKEIIPNFDEDLSIYAGLGDLVNIVILDFDRENNGEILKLKSFFDDKDAVKKLIDINPETVIHDGLFHDGVSAEEFFKGEEWVDYVLQGIKPDWSDVQKIAYIHTQIGKRCSYSPEHDTEVEKPISSRIIWKIINSGYGVCNGISQLELYLLKRAGIDSKMLSSGCHAFILLENTEIPTPNGMIRGNTLLDPTWDLASSRFNGKPFHFYKSYKDLREADISPSGKDSKAHKCSILEQIDTVSMDESCMRDVFKSIGLTNENGEFFIKDVMEKVQEIDNTSESVEENIRAKFELLRNIEPNFAQTINSTMKIIQNVLFVKNEKINYGKSVISRVYDKSNDERNAVMAMYFDFLDGKGKRFFYADREKGEMIELPAKEFIERFDCYDYDIEAFGNKRFWELDKEIETSKEVSSGEIVGRDGE